MSDTATVLTDVKPSAVSPEAGSHADSDSLIRALMLRARRAQRELEDAGQETADAAVLAAAWALLKPQHNRALSQMAVAVTGLGNAADKVIKNTRKTLGLLRDMQGEKTLGIIRTDRASGITEVLRPLGVIGAVTPSTNPVATPLNNILNALKTGNAIILAPSPKGLEVARALLERIKEEFRSCALPLKHADDLIQVTPAARRELTQAMMRQADCVVVTGSQNNVRAGYASGTPCLGVGAGNVTVIIDETADAADAAQKIAASKTFDNATSCSSENSVILVQENAAAALRALQNAGGLLLDEDDKARLQQCLWQNGALNRDLIAKDAAALLAALNRARAEGGLPPLPEALPGAAQKTTFLMVREQHVGKEYPYSGEKMSPVLTLYQAADFTAAAALAERLLNHQGRGHSVGLHTADGGGGGGGGAAARPEQLAQRLPACRVIVNQAHCFATGGAFNNGLPFSLSMGCGAWGGNSFSDNFNFRLLSHRVRIARAIAPREPSLDDIFAPHWQRVEHAPRPEAAQ